MNTGADRVQGHSRLRYIYDNCRMTMLIWQSLDTL